MANGVSAGRRRRGIEGAARGRRQGSARRDPDGSEVRRGARAAGERQRLQDPCRWQRHGARRRGAGAPDRGRAARAQQPARPARTGDQYVSRPGRVRRQRGARRSAAAPVVGALRSRADRTAVAELGPVRCPRLARPGAGGAWRQGRRACGVRSGTQAGARLGIREVQACADVEPQMTTAPAHAVRTIELHDRPAAGTPELRLVARVAAFIAGWTAFVAVMALIVTIEKGVPLRYSLMSSAANYVPLAGCSIVVWLASAWMAARRWHWASRALAHVVMGVALIAAWQWAYAVYMMRAIGPGAWTRIFAGTLLFQLSNAAILYGGIVAVTLAMQAAARERAQEQRQHALALAARDAEMRALVAQLEPHFLLNTLNSILALIESSSRDASLMIERLSSLLKAALDGKDEATVPLGRELDLLEAYLGIEQVRVGDRLRVTIEAPEALRALPVPPLLLQPLVENAIKHGVSAISGPVAVAVTARADGDRVRLAVIDSGPGFDYASAIGRGRGLDLVERRLAAFDPTGDVHTERMPSGFAVVVSVSG